MLRIQVKTNAQALRVFEACYGQGVTLWDTWPGAWGRVLWIAKPLPGIAKAIADAIPSAIVSEMKP